MRKEDVKDMEKTKETAGVQEPRLKLPDRLPENFRYTPEGGLTQTEAEEKIRQGEANRMTEEDGKSLRRILADNLFTLFNFLNAALAVCLLLVGSYRNMLFVLIVAANILIGTVQEYRAQQTIRKLKLLSAPEVHVIRDGREVTLKVEETVRGDLVVLRSGDQVVADAVIVDGSGSAMESLLTGESDAVPKKVNSWLYSGSYITEGRMLAQLVYVADDSYVGRLTREAKKTVRPGSRLMNEMNRLIRFDSMVLVPLGILLFLKQTLLLKAPLTSAVPSTVAAMIGMIPEGLVLLTSIAMAVGVVKLARRKTLVQELAGIETLARADVLCLDKTGTITTGDMTVEALEGVEEDEASLRRELSRFLGAFDEKSGTLNALRRAVAPALETTVAVLPFSSERKKSAATFQDGTALILGAPEFVLGEKYPPELRAHVNELAAQGKRVVLLAAGEGIVNAENMPEIRKIVGLCILKDEIRPGAEETLSYFRRQGVTVKVISGDNPKTVSRIARMAGLEGWESMVDATTLTTPEALQEAAEIYTVFGRVTPEQKKLLVEAMKRNGHNVAMTGDGVNDIPALKAADCSIAMAGGSDAARNAAQLTLLESDFGVMPQIVLEGRRVINNITRAASLFLTKTLFSFLLSMLLLFIPGTYPFQPIQMTLVSGLTVGIPGFFLALEPSEERIRGNFLRTVLMRALPGGVAVALCALAAMSLTWFGWPESLCSTLSTMLAGAVGFVVLTRTCLPLNLHRGVLVGVLIAAFTVICMTMRKMFFLDPLTGPAWIALGVLAALGCAIVLVTASVVKKKGWDTKEEPLRNLMDSRTGRKMQEWLKKLTRKKESA